MSPLDGVNGARRNPNAPAWRRPCRLVRLLPPRQVAQSRGHFSFIYRWLTGSGRKSPSIAIDRFMRPAATGTAAQGARRNPVLVPPTAWPAHSAASIFGGAASAGDELERIPAGDHRVAVLEHAEAAIHCAAREDKTELALSALPVPPVDVRLVPQEAARSPVVFINTITRPQR
jgi:hypothetical protein